MTGMDDERGVTVMAQERNQERRLRARAARRGYVLKKSRRAISIDNHGDFMVVDADRNAIVLGSRFDATLDDIHTFLTE